MDFLAEEGFSSYAGGLVWTVDPDEYAWVAEEWVESCPDVPPSSFYVFARNAYGEFYCLSLDTGFVITISCPTGLLAAPREMLKKRGNPVQAVQTFFAMGSMAKYDLVDENGVAIFPAALKKLGPVGPNEIYGFVPLVTLGGVPSVKTMEKVRMDVHLDILRGTAEPFLQLI